MMGADPGTNYQITSQRHAAVLAHWHKAYGAELMSMSQDIMIFYVAKPPTDHDVVKALALEWASYCPDAIDQGAETMENLAKDIRGHRYWWFWWD